MAIKERKVMKSCGQKGRPIKVETNHLPMQLSRIVPLATHYDVTITPDRPTRMMRPVWNAFRQMNFPNIYPAFDEKKNAFSPRKIPEERLVGEVTLAEDEYERPKTYKVVLKYAATVNLTALNEYFTKRGQEGLPKDALQCLDIVLRNSPAMRFVRVGRSYFTPPDRNRIISLGDGVELWHGFYQSAILGWKPYLNVDVAHKGFPSEMVVLDLMAELTRTSVRFCCTYDFLRSGINPRRPIIIFYFLCPKMDHP